MYSVASDSLEYPAANMLIAIMLDSGTSANALSHSALEWVIWNPILLKGAAIDIPVKSTFHSLNLFTRHAKLRVSKPGFILSFKRKSM